MLTPRNDVDRIRTSQARLPIGPGTAEKQQELRAAEGRRMRVLLVEDDERVSESNRRLLESEGFQVDCAFDGESGLAMAQRRSYDVILLDRRLPNLSGDDVLERLRREGNSTPVLMLTAYPDYESAHRSGVLGAARYLLKSMMVGAPLAAAIRAAALGTVMPRKTPRLFSAYGGKTSRSFSDLLDFVRSDGVNPSELPRQLARAISARDLTFAEFLAAAKSLCFLNRKAHLRLERLLLTVRDWLDPASTARMLDSKLESILARLEAAGPNWAEISEEDLAVDLHVNRITVWRCIGDEISVTFPGLRRAIVIRRAVLLLAETPEHVRQIAFQLGYDDPGRLDKDFDAFLNLPPTQFRRLCD